MRDEPRESGRTPHAVGARAEGAVLAELMRLGKTVLIPIGVHPRYDLLVDERGCFVRVQVKTGRLGDGAIEFATASCKPTPRATRRPYHGECEVFGVYCPELDRVYFVPVTECGGRGASLRIESSRNGQWKRIRWAKDYLEFPAPVAQVVRAVDS